MKSIYSIRCCRYSTVGLRSDTGKQVWKTLKYINGVEKRLGLWDIFHPIRSSGI